MHQRTKICSLNKRGIFDKISGPDIQDIKLLSFKESFQFFR